jgi:hypothetical protein
MGDENRPLPAAVSEYMTDRPGATSTEVMDAVEVDEQYREQVEHYCAITRFTLFKNEEANDAEGLRWDTVEWADVAEWNIPSEKDQ